jgi:hypothetical protein
MKELMMNRFLIVFLFIFSALAAAEWSEQFHIEWNQPPLNLQRRAVPGAMLGPVSFLQKADTLLLLDAASNRIIRFEKGQFLSQQETGIDGLEDFLLLDAGLLIMAKQRLWYIDGPKRRQIAVPVPKKAVIKALEKSEAGIELKLSSGEKMSNADRKLSDFLLQPELITVRKSHPGSGTVYQNGKALFTLSGEDFGAIQPVKVNEKHLWLYVERIQRHIPLQVERQLRAYDFSGHLISAVELPRLQSHHLFREYRITDDDKISLLFSGKEGLHILHLNPLENENQPFIPFPEKYRQSPPVNDSDEKERQLLPQPQGALPKETVTRQEALDIADSYYQHVWSASESNITNGQITDPDGNPLETPEWVTVGINYDFPYKWGGFNTLASYDAGLLEGKSAGDKATSAVSRFAVGVDCSGYVSRCWKLTYHVSTYQMDQPGGITLPYDTWYELQPADAVHRVGHVRLMVQWNDDGSLLLVEATGTGWRVRYHTFTLSELSTYTPRYYVNMEGSPGNLTQPAISLLSGGQNGKIMLQWNPIESADVAGLRLYREVNNAWIADSDTIIPLNPPFIEIPAQAASLQSFRLHTLSSGDSSTKSLPSDAYAVINESPKLLIVDGFDRFGGSGSWQLPYHNFAASLGKSLHSLGIAFATAANEAVENGLIDLDDFEAVFWILGDESTQHETFNNAEQEKVIQYLQQGGKLFVSGSEIAWDLDNKGSENDKSFIHDFLKAGYGEDNSGNHTALGEAGTPFAGLNFAFDDGSGGIYEEDYPDVFTQKNGSSVLLRYGNQKIAGLGFQGTFSGGTRSGAVVTMGFPVETILQEEAREELIAAILSFFEMDVSFARDLSLPHHFLISPAYPNPFNEQISFKLLSDLSEPLQLTLINLQGKTVYQRQWVFSQQGEQTISVNLPQLSSGVYFYQLTQNKKLAAGKITLLK